jgi:hypothetical protein
VGVQKKKEKNQCPREGMFSVSFAKARGVRWEGYDKKGDTWEPITHLQGYATMVKS